MSRLRSLKRNIKRMTKRYITILPDILCMTLEGDKPLYIKDKDDTKGKVTTHAAFIIDRSSDASFAILGLKGMQASMAIRNAVKGAKPGDVVAIDEDDWEKLAAATKMPSAMGAEGKLVDVGYRGDAGPQLLPFMSAITNATSNDPRGTQTEG